MNTYSMDLREWVLKAVVAGMSTSAVAEKYEFSTAWVRRLKPRRAATGQIGPKVQRRGPTSVIECRHNTQTIRVALHQLENRSMLRRPCFFP
jgi:transposase